MRSRAFPTPSPAWRRSANSWRPTYELIPSGFRQSGAGETPADAGVFFAPDSAARIDSRRGLSVRERRSAAFYARAPLARLRATPGTNQDKNNRSKYRYHIDAALWSFCAAASSRMLRQSTTASPCCLVGERWLNNPEAKGVFRLSLSLVDAAAPTDRMAVGACARMAVSMQDQNRPKRTVLTLCLSILINTENMRPYDAFCICFT